eukprot:symbB.v1.2.003434.t1/scaffold195.1/size274553/5
MALAWLSQQWATFRQWLGRTEVPVQLEVVHLGGAMLRETAELTSPEVAMVHRGERVLLLHQVGRRAHVRTSDGFTGWLSLQTLDQMDIAVKVEATGKVDGNGPSFREEFESKWRRLRVDLGPSEAPFPSVRQSSGRIPISQWRPGLKLPVALDHGKPQRSAVPKLRPPSETPRKESSKATSSHSGGKAKDLPAVHPGEDLLDFNEPKKDMELPGRWPDLAQILAAGSNPPSYRGSNERSGDGDGIPDAPPSRRESQFNTAQSWQEVQLQEEASLLSQFPRFEQLLDQQPDPEEAEVQMTFSSYEMEDAMVEDEERD